jgi:hypothetical protein
MNIKVQAFTNSVEDSRRDVILALQDIVLRNFPTALVEISNQTASYTLPSCWTFLKYNKDGVTLMWDTNPF